MRLGETTRLQASINITPLVDVVLVLLIIFMVMVPQMHKGPDVHLPHSAKAREQGDERSRMLVPIDEAAALRINEQPVRAERFVDSLPARAGAEQPDTK